MNQPATQAGRAATAEHHLRTSLRNWFRPPRAHGDVVADRTVSFLELFYDLVYVVLIAQLAHTLAVHITWDGMQDFVVLFVLVWFGWLNGTMYHELHGGEDGRSRSYIFTQMGILAFLAVYAGHAGDEPADGRGFAVLYTILLAVLVWQWFDVWRHDRPEMRPLATPFLVGLLAVTGLSFAGIFVEQDVRRTIWLIAVVLILLGGLSQSLRSTPLIEEAVRVTESMAERFGLFTIIVLGEMVVGVVDGVSESERQAIHLVTAGLALFVGTGFWWNYFDFVGRRVPRAGAAARSAWIYGHLVLATAVAATGAGLVALVEHAGDSRLPVNVSWLVAGGISGVAFGIALLVAVMPRRPGAARVAPLLVCTGTIVLMVAALRPAGWLLAIAALGSFSFVWFDAFVLHSRDGDPIAR